MSLLAEEPCPISESLFGRLYRASPEGVTALIETIPDETRAMLAVYCYRRAHLESLGLAIAATCREQDLQKFGGRAGAELFSLAHMATAAEDEAKPESSKGISLASGRLWNPPSLEE